MKLSSVSRRTLWSVALAFGVASGASAQTRVVIPAGTVILVRTTTALESSTAKAGQTFETKVEESVGVNEYTAIPAGSTIRGTITVATPATRRQSGVIEVVFDRLTLASGATYPISGTLTSTDSAERRQIESDPNAHVVLVGERGGIGAVIAGAGSARGTNNILSALGAMLSEGRDVSVAAGTPMAVKLETALAVNRGTRAAGQASTIYTAPERIRAAQQALANLNYYRGPLNGVLDDPTRQALFEFQLDRGLRGTGNLDGRTAAALGLDLTGGLSGTVLTVTDASVLRRDAQNLVGRVRSELAASTAGQLNANRAYAQGDLELWFAVSAFADNASIYEQIVRNGGNQDAAVLAGRALANAARRVDAAIQGTRTSASTQSAWTALRRQITVIDTPSGT